MNKTRLKFVKSLNRENLSMRKNMPCSLCHRCLVKESTHQSSKKMKMKMKKRRSRRILMKTSLSKQEGCTKEGKGNTDALVKKNRSSVNAKSMTD